MLSGGQRVLEKGQNPLLSFLQPAFSAFWKRGLISKHRFKEKAHCGSSEMLRTHSFPCLP